MPRICTELANPAHPTGRRPGRPNRARVLLAGLSLLALAACENSGGFDFDLRRGDTLDTSAAARNATAPRPEPDARGVISYPTYQVAVAQRGDTVRSVAARVGLPAEELARYNAVSPEATLNKGEILALPKRVSEPPSGTSGAIDITTLASGAIDRASGSQTPAAGGAASAPAVGLDGRPISTQPYQTLPGGVEPVRHRVERGETAYTIARAYNVSVRSLADWNGLTGDLAVREGQYLLIPVALASAAAPAAVDGTAPGQGSPAPLPPSASQPLPAEKTTPASTPVAAPPAPDLGSQKTASSRLQMPVNGKIIRGYEKKKNDGIDIAATAGAAVQAAEAGTVAAITKDTDQVPILVIRHPNNLLTVYANVDAISVAKGDSVKRGQAIAKVRAGSPAFVHFEVRNGYDSVDPMGYLQ